MSGRRRVSAALVMAGLVAAVLSASTGARVAAAPRSVHFTAAGDYGTTTTTATVLEGMAAARGELSLALGDLSLGVTGQEQAFCDFVTTRVGAGYPFELIAGNHESNGQNGNINDFGACLPNQLPGAVGTYGREWYVDYPQDAPTVRFVMISPDLSFPDGYWSYAVGSPHYAWTANAIDGARAAGIPWVVVGMHDPCLSVGEYACGSTLAAVANLLLQKKVDLVLTGHEHLYQRTKQLTLGSGCSSLATNSYDPDCVADADNQLVKGAGTVFATVGTGGTALRDVHPDDPEAPYFAQLEGANTAASHGFLDVVADAATLTARFVATSGSYADAFTIAPSTEPPTNQPPTAVIAAPTCTALSCSFDGTGSSDVDGTIVTYAWDFGDGATASGATASHTYTSDGAFVVNLTVTDDEGATGSASRSVVVSTTPQPVVRDSFNRSVATGLGTADVGGSWALTGPASDASVSGGAGLMVMRSPSGGALATLPAVTTVDADATAVVSVDKVATGSGIYLNLVGRRVTNGGDYRGQVRLVATGAVSAVVSRKTWQNVSTVVLPSRDTGLTLAPGEQLALRLQVVGTNPTTLRMKVWRVGTPEPSSWLLSGTDSTAALQQAGYVGLQPCLSGSATNAPVTMAVDDLTVIPTAP